MFYFTVRSIARNLVCSGLHLPKSVLFLYQMDAIKTEISNQTLTCESCGKPFECGAKTGKCWCFEVDLDAEKLAKLREDFENCLCQECLEKGIEPQINTN